MTEAPRLRNVAEALPLSPSQAGMLYEILSDGPGYYLSPHWCDFEGDIDPESLIEIFREELLRHEMSRACIVHREVKRPFQIIRETAELPIGYEDWSGCADIDARAAELEARLERQVPRLDKAPLMAATLVRTGERTFSFVLVIHHMISDGWSLNVVLEDVVARLNGGHAGPEGTPFRAHLARLKSMDRTELGAFWRRELDGLDGPTLVTGQGATAGTGHVRRDATLDRKAAGALRHLAKRSRVTLATVLTTAWAMTLRRLTGRDDVVFGIVSSGRDPALKGIRRAVGPYLSVVPARLRLDRNASGIAALAEAEAAALRRRPFELVGMSEALTLGDNPSRVLFDTVLAIKTLDPPARSGPIRLTNVRARMVTGTPLTMNVLPGETIEFIVTTDASRLSPGAAGGLLDLYLATLRGLVEAPTSTLREIPRPDPKALDPPPRFRPVHRAIHDRAREDGDAIALAGSGGEISYAMLDGRAQALAATLTARGIGAGDIVPILLPRSESYVIAILGVLHAGAAYAPLDPDYPSDRIASILDQLSARMMIGESALHGLECVSVPETAGTCEPASPAGDDPAYVIFTSGSTGRPKGVVVTHANLAWSTFARDAVYGSPPAAFLHLSSFAFDSSVVGLYWTLCNGGRLVIAPPRAEQDAAGLARLAEAQTVTHLLALPRLWSAILATVERTGAAMPASLDTVIVAGEAVPPGLVPAHRAAAPHVRVFNEYGPTEATVWCAATEITDETDPVPIGHAPPGAALEVCDRDGLPLPPGFKGDLVVRGAGVARGYLGRPDLTAEVFRDGRYRTGDIGWQRDDGAVVYSGRHDDQVKLRGYRVELGEIEAAARDAGARDALAALVGDRIILVVVAEEELSLDGRLPRWAMPGAICRVDAIPTLPNGKGDRAAVAAMETDAPATSAAAAEGFFETKLAEVWSDLLKLDATPETHFFDAGGDSLLSITMLARLEDEGVMLHPNDIFEFPKLEDLAAHLRDRMHRAVPARHQSIVLSNEEGTERPFLMFHGHPKIHAGLGAALGRNRPLIFNYSHHYVGDLPLGERIADLAAGALDIMRERYPDGPYVFGGYSVGGVIAIEAARQVLAAGQSVSALFLVDPAYDAAAPRGQSDPAALRLRRFVRAVMAGTRLRLPMGDRGTRANEFYRACLWHYRLPVLDVPTLLFQSAGGARHEGPLAAALPGAQRVPLPFGHQDLQKNDAAVEQWTARLSATLRALEKDERHG